MLHDLKIAENLTLLLLAAFAAQAPTGPVALQSPNGALEISIATLRDQTPQPAGGQLACRVAFGGQPVLDWSILGLAPEAQRARARQASHALKSTP